MNSRDPEKIQHDINYYEEPNLSHTYVLTADVSKGRGQDYSTFSVIDITNQPFKQVCTYRNNTISPLLFPDVIIRAAKTYNDALVIIENNDAGQVVCNAVYYEHEYENTFTTSTVKSNGIGVTMSAKVKRMGCSNLKDLLEGGKLLLVDPNTIAEFSSFEPKGNSYSGASGTHDDSVMNFVLFAWFVSTDFFRSLTDIEIKDLLYKERILEMEEDLPPFGYMHGSKDNRNDEHSNLVDNIKDWKSAF